MNYFFTKHSIQRLKEIGLDKETALFYLQMSQQSKKLSPSLKRYKYKKYGVVRSFSYYRSNGLRFVIKTNTNPHTVITVSKIP